MAAKKSAGAAASRAKPPVPAQPAAPGFPVWLPALLAALATAAVFSCILSNGLLNWDDPKNLVENLHYRGWTAANLRWIFAGSFGFMGNYEPLHWLTMSLVNALGGPSARSFHGAALLQHAAAAAVFYFVALRLLRAALPQAAERDARICAAAASLLFALHPLRVEAVAWASGQHYVEAGLYYLLALLCWLRFAERPRLAARLAALFFFALSLLSIPIGMTLPAALLLLDLYPLRRWSPAEGWGPKARSLLLEKAPFFALAAAAGAAGILAKKSDGALITLALRGPAIRLVSTLFGLAYYLGRTLWPATLYPFHEQALKVDVWAPVFVSSGAAVLALTAGFAALRRTRPALLAALAFYALSLLPVLGITQSGSQLVADRYSYLACLAWPLLAAGGLLALSRGRRRAYAAGLALAAGAAVLLAARTRAYCAIWRDSETFWQHNLKYAPGSPIGHSHLGVAYLEQDRYDEALAQFQTALRINPDFDIARTNVDLTLSKKAHPALEQGMAAGREGRMEEAVGYFQRALEIAPNYAAAHNNLGAALTNLGRTAEAEEQYREAIRCDPAFPDPRANLGALLASRGKFDEAERQLREALKLKPDSPKAAKDLAAVLKARGRP